MMALIYYLDRRKKRRGGGDATLFIFLKDSNLLITSAVHGSLKNKEKYNEDPGDQSTSFSRMGQWHATVAVSPPLESPSRC